jgi:hypothetical protein
VNEAKVMDCVNGKYTFCNVETRDIFGECVIFDEHGHEVTAREKLHDKIQRLCILEGIEQLNHPSGVGLGKNIAFSTDVRQLRMLPVARFCHNEEKTYLILFQHFLLLQCFHGIDFTGIGLLDQPDLSTILPYST